MTVLANNKPVIVDVDIGSTVNTSIALMNEKVYPHNTEYLYKELVKAFNGSETGGFLNQNWVSYLAYDIGYSNVFDVFSIPRTDITSIKLLVAYNYNPSLENFISFLQAIIGDISFIIEEGDGLLELYILNVELIVSLLAIGGETLPNNLLTPIDANVTTERLQVIQPSSFDFFQERLYILQNYKMAGVNLNVFYSSTFRKYLELAKKYNKTDKWIEYLNNNLDKLEKYSKLKNKVK